MADSLSLAVGFREQNATPNKLTRGQAILYSQSVRSSWRRPPLQAWNEDRESDLLDDAVRLILAGEVEHSRAPSATWRNSYRRAGEIFEWLYQSGSSQPPLYSVISAACYQVAGFPALAAGILGNLPQVESPDLFHQVVKSYIAADFFGVTRQIKTFVDSDDSTPEPWIAREICQTLMVISACLLINGETEQLEAGRQKLVDLARLAARKLPPYLWLLIKLLTHITKHFIESNIYNVSALSELLTPDGREYLREYCFRSCVSGRSLLWPSQAQGIKRLTETNSFVLATPTGSGKTSVALFSIIRFLFDSETQNQPPGLCLYLVPSRALASEAEGKLAEYFASSNRARMTITGLYGGIDWGLFDAWLTLDRHTILVSTVEKAEAILRYLGKLLMQRLSLIILDEAHHVNLDYVDPRQKDSLFAGENRAARVETFVSRIRTLRPTCPVIGLSAVAGGIQDNLARWLTGSVDATALTGDARSTRQLVGTLACKRDGSSTIWLNFLNGKTLELARDREAAYFLAPFKDLSLRGLSQHLGSITGFLRLHSFWAAIQLSLAGKFVLCSILQKIQNDLKVLAELVGSRWSVPSSGLLTAECLASEKYRACVQACADFCGPDSYEAVLLRRGIAVHHGQLPMRVRRLMTDVISERLVKFTIATSTLTEGVNLPFDVVILPSFVRMKYDGERTQTSLMVASEFLNLAGRAGRPGRGSEGMTLIVKADDIPAQPGTKAATLQKRALFSHTRNYAGFMNDITQSLQAQSTSPIQTLLNEIYSLWTAVSNQVDENAFYSWLEETIPAEETNLDRALDSLDTFLNDSIQAFRELNTDELSPSEMEELAQNLWRSTYAAICSNNARFYQNIFVVRSAAISNLYDEEYLRISYATGVSPGRIVEFKQLYEKIIGLFVGSSDYDTLDVPEQVAFFEQIAEQLQSTRTFQLKSPNYLEVLRWWLRHPDAQAPGPDKLRDWLKTVNEDFIFRMSATIGSILARRWSERTTNKDQLTPNLTTWREDTEMPWISFWTRELLAWGTTDPVEAYLFAAGTVADRTAAQTRSSEFREWARGSIETAEILSPNSIRTWLSSDDPPLEAVSPVAAIDSFPLTSLEPELSQRQHLVFPSLMENRILWFEPAGHVVGESPLGEQSASTLEAQAIYYLDPVSRSVRRYKTPPII